MEAIEPHRKAATSGRLLGPRLRLNCAGSNPVVELTEPRVV